ncbi:monovalent cation/H(+) antiporter subunit G [Archangium violaceum]|uniref:cation:proton antiporter n=1 Tax=Archangium violaceum TaxID=83451 RepID=UPI00193BF164|nr:monovalent cation/H(+) antiporter subunit G [Archangium violaceum]QRK05913.1 monovalent cation/H(+) antiporter subunit G [Archangium violaceum]
MKWLADVLVLGGTLVLTLSVLGILRLPHVLFRLHAAGQAVLPGVAAILLATLGTGEVRLVSRALLVCVFLLLTAPVSSHAIARAAWQKKARRDSTPPGTPQP